MRKRLTSISSGALGFAIVWLVVYEIGLSDYWSGLLCTMGFWAGVMFDKEVMSKKN